MHLLLHGNAAVALAAAIVWGGGDFSGGIAVKAAGGSLRSAFRVILISHTVSLSILLLLALTHGGPLPSHTTVAWGLTGGLLAALSLAAFYVSLSGGAMGAAAALSGLLAAAIPAAVSFATEGLPGTLPLLGFLLAAIAIWLIAATPAASPEALPGNNAATPLPPSGPLPASGEPALSGPPPADRRTMLLATLGGIGFGLYFVAMKMAGRGGLLWPMTTVRIGSATTCALLVLATLRTRITPDQPTAPYLPRKAVLWALGPALLDTGGNLLFMASTRMGRLDVASVLASLYPASTILLAAWMLHERPTPRQGLGMLTAAAAVLMITL